MFYYSHQHKFILVSRQVVKDVSYTGGVIGMLSSLAAFLIGITIGLLSGSISKAIGGSCTEDGLFLHKQGR